MSLEGFRTAHPRPRRCPRPRRRSGGGAAAGGAGGASERPQRAGVVTGTAATRRVSVLGSTGSVGRNTLDLISRHPERFAVTALAAGSNAELLAEQARRTGAGFVALADKSAWPALKTGRGSGREEGCRVGLIRVGARTLKKKK